MLGMTEKRMKREPRQLKPKELSLLMQDIDTVWMDERSPEGDAELLRQLANAAPEEAARALAELLSATEAIQLEDRLDALGVACGVLRKNAGIPSGFRSMWRSTLPVLLIAEEIPANYDRPTEIARSLGCLIYGSNAEVVDVFADGLRSSFVEIEGSMLAAELNQPGKYLRRMLGSLAHRP